MNRPSMKEEVQALERLDLDGLRAFWRERYGPPPGLRSRELLGLMLAWRIQAEALGGLDPAARRRLKRKGPLEARACTSASARVSGASGAAMWLRSRWPRVGSVTTDGSIGASRRRPRPSLG
jgi:hypothetical protein